MSLRHAGPYIWIPLPTLNFYLSPNLPLSHTPESLVHKYIFLIICE